MSIKTETISYGPDNGFSGYAAYEERNVASLPAVLVLQEIWGVDAHIRDVVERIARAGYFAFAPDLYSENGRRLPVYEAGRIEETKSFLNSVPPPDWHNQERLQQALGTLPEASREPVKSTLAALFGGNRSEKYREQLLASASFLHESHPLTKGRAIGSIGFCMGGGLSALLAGLYPKLGAAVMFYGRPPAEDVVPGIGCPVLGFFGENDASLTPRIPEFSTQMERAGKMFEPHIYAGAGHAFFNDTRASYHVDAARDSYARTLAFLAGRLAQDPHTK